MNCGLMMPSRGFAGYRRGRSFVPMKVRARPVKPIGDRCRVIKRHGRVLVLVHEPATQATAGVRRELGSNRRRQPSARKAPGSSVSIIYGIGPSTVRARPRSRSAFRPIRGQFDLTDGEVSNLRAYIRIDNLEVEGDLRRERSQNVKRLQEIGAYRGIPGIAAVSR